MAAYTHYSWCKDWLRLLGNAYPSTNTLNLVIAWATEEGGAFTNSCLYNLLNTERFVANCWNCTNLGIKAYETYYDGLIANKMAIENGLYESLRQALIRNDEHSLGLLGTDMINLIKEDFTVWVDGVRNPINVSYISNIMNIYRSL